MNITLCGILCRIDWKIVMGLSEKRSIVHPSLGAVSPLSLPGLLAMCFSITYVTSYWLTCCNIPEDLNLNQKVS
jgi:hypothetical protein